MALRKGRRISPVPGSSGPFDNPRKTPTCLTAPGCCALATTGHAATPPTIPRNARRLMHAAPARGAVLYGPMGDATEELEYSANESLAKIGVLCRLWVNRDDFGLFAACPLCSRKRISKIRFDAR